MINNIALDTCIGLIFIFLLYSLLATTIREMIAQIGGARARQLYTAIKRMLEDDETKGNASSTEKENNKNRTKSPSFANAFYTGKATLTDPVSPL